MEYGFAMPSRGHMASPESLAALARLGEEKGFGFLCASDHVVIPRTIESTYPYSEGGAWTGTDECLEQLTLLSFLAGQTKRIKLLTSVMVLPYRPPVLAAKVLATIDVLSGGRLIVGCGVGWMREEFEALGAPPYDDRGSVGDEYIRAFKELWTNPDPSLDGKYASFADVAFAPKPVQKPHPPIWIGGESPPALRRAARLGDAWYPIGNNPRYPLGTVELLSASVDRLRRYADQVGRDGSEIDITYSAAWYDDTKAQKLPGGQRRVMTGTPDTVAGDIRALGALGVRHMMLGVVGPTLDQSAERMERFATKVAPLVGD